MRYRDNPELQDRLAAEYVLGTLRGGARLRFQAWLRQDAALRNIVTDWERRLAPMALGIAEVRPPARVWKNIDARIARPAAHQRDTAAASVSWWDSLNFWRNWGLVATGCAAALVVTNAIRAPEVIERELVRTVEIESPRMQPSYVATLEDSNGNMVFMAYAARKSDELWVKSVAMAPLEPGQAYELWGMPKEPGMPVKSLGMVPAAHKGTIKLAAVADQSLSDFPRLAISVEPLGGSSTGQPTGPVMYKGVCNTFW